MDCQKEFRITLKDKTFIRFCKFFCLQIFAQIRARRKVLMGLNEDYDLHRCRRMLNQSNSQKKVLDKNKTNRNDMQIVDVGHR